MEEMNRECRHGRDIYIFLKGAGGGGGECRCGVTNLQT